MQVGDFRKLRVWRRSQTLAVTIYRVTSGFPPIERFGIAEQMRRSALSVSSNIAEGCGRRSDAELRRFVRISRRSLAELESQLLVAVELSLVSHEQGATILEEIHAVRGMLGQMHRWLAVPRG